MKEENRRITKARQKEKKDSNRLLNAERFYPSTNFGLTFQQVEQRKEENLTNNKPINRSKSYFRILYENFFNFCNVVTLSLVVLLIVIGEPNQAVSSCIIFLNIFIGVYQEIKAKKTVEKLSLVVESTCEVLREGKKNEISTREIVLDDLFLLNSGNQVPVDAKIVDGFVEVDESILTGESINVKKNNNATILAGSYIVSGEALVKAEKVGKDCYIENVARIARRVSKPHSNIFKVLDKIIKGISFALIPLALLLFISTRIVAHATISNTIIQVAGSILGMLPIGMFLLASTALASSVLKLSKKNTLAQDLYSVEMLAMVDTLLLDKTGTITDGNLEVVENKFLSEEKYNLNDIFSFLFNATHDKNTTAIAFKNKYKNDNIDIKKISGCIPFSSERKFSAVEIEGKYVYCLGAPNYAVSMNDEISAFINKNSLNCRRTLILGKFGGKLIDMKKENVEPVCMFALEDKLREDVNETLKWFAENDVDIKIVSGDNPLTVSKIAQKTGEIGAENYINCSDINDIELENQINATVFGRVSPEQKSKIVNILQKKGRTVGMIGDGVNDVQALKEADCSISFASANEVARNISRIILMDSNFKTLPNVVSEGRRVISNVEKISSLYVMKNIFVMFMTLLFSIIAFVVKKDLYPFVPTRMLLIEFFVIGVPTVCFALQSNTKRTEGNFLYNIMKRCIPAGISLIFGVGLILILMATNVIDTSYIGNAQEIQDYQSSLSVVALTMSGFSALAIVALPKNKYRIVVISIMFFIFVGALLLDQYVLDGWFFTVDIIKNPLHLMWIGISSIFATLIHILSNFVIKKYGIKWKEKNDYFFRKKKRKIQQEKNSLICI